MNHDIYYQTLLCQERNQFYQDNKAKYLYINKQSIKFSDIFGKSMYCIAVDPE